MSGVVATWAPARPLRMPAELVRWAEAERGRFGPWLAAGMVAGAGGYFMWRAEPAAWAGAAGLLAAVLACTLGWRWAATRGAGLMAVAVAVGFAAAQAGTWRALPSEPVPSKAVVLTATVRGVDVLPDGRRLVLEDVRLTPGAEPMQRRVRVRMKKGDATPVAAGDAVQVRTVLRAPSPPTYPGGWDQQRDAFFNGIAAGGTALNPVVVLGQAPVRGWAARIQAVRDAIAARVMAAIPGPAGAVGAALLTGSTVAIPQADRAAFRDSGLAHLLAVAGLHIGIIMGLFLLVTRLGLAAWPYAALHWPTKAIAAAVALAAGGAYLVLTGAHVPIVRSFAMACLVTLAIVVGRRALSLRGLALAAAAIVLIAPNEVVGVSFQMSFAAVLALIAGYEAMRPMLARLQGRGWRRVAMHVAMLMLTSLLAGTASAPYGAYHFGHVQAYFILANLIAVPLTAFWVVPLGVLGLFLMPFGLDELAFWPMGWGLDGILLIARAVAGLPAATMAAPAMPAWGLAVFSAGLAWSCLWRTPVRLAGLAVMLAGLLSPVIAPAPDLMISNDGRLIVLRGEDGYRIQARSGASKFVREAWENRLGVPDFPPLGPGCDPAACRRGPMLLLRGATPAADCTGVTLVVSAEPARGVCPGVGLLDRFTVWRDGAHAVWLRGGGVSVLSDRAERGARPWVPGLPVARRVVPDLPMALTEPLPAEEEK